MSDETTVVEQQQPQAEPSLMESYGERSLEGGAPKEPEKTGRNTTLSEEEDTARSIANLGEEEESKRKPKQRQTLAEAFEGVQPQEAEDLELPEILQGFSLDYISALMIKHGLSAEDIQDQRIAGMLREEMDRLENYEPDESEEEEPTEEKAEDEKAGDEKTSEGEAKKAPVHPELQPEEIKKYLETTWEKAQQINAPQMSKLFEESLAATLGTPAESRETLHDVCELLSYGGTSLVQSAVPAMVDEYLQQNFAPHMMRYFAPALEHFVPGIQAAFNNAQADTCWNKVREENEAFADLPDFESKEFIELRDKIVANSPWIDSWDPDPNMPPLKALEEKAKLFARLAIGERVDPKRVAAQMAQAIETGRRSAQSTHRRVSASRTMGNAEKSTGRIGGEVSDREGLMAAWKRGGGGGAL